MSARLLKSRFVHLMSCMILVVMLCSSIAQAAPSPAPNNPPPRPSRRMATGGPTQFGPTGDGSLLVWTERALAAIPAEETDLGTADIRGVDLATNQPVVISNAVGDQTLPAVSGSIVVWQDNGHSCPTCERDIRAKDLATGIIYDVATGPADQAMPAIAGRTVAWIENSERGLRLLSAELGSTQVTELAAVSAGTTISRPVMSNALIVWAEQTWPDRSNPARPHSSTVYSKLRAYDRTTGQTKLVAEPTFISLEYAVSGTQIVYTDPRAVLVDLAKNSSRILSEQFVTAPAIAGDTVVWSAAEPTADDLDIYSFDLKRGKRISLINTPGNQVSAVIIGDTLVWQDEADKAGKAQIKRQSLREATNNARPRRPTERTPEPQVAAPREEAITPMGHTGTYTRPTYKGMHLALGGYDNGWGGWYFATEQRSRFRALARPL
ncbi:hypothetical protein [Kallotenue papyrolyticum]|uniref:hypothetical protein n=1 Tax=Kallotenue papyrolyticum TaxID=1325125 RepID=UPI001268F861|nr:hypothetical protein [Kallotenue papyrolyticum]